MNVTELLERFRRGPELVAGVMTGAAAEEVDYLSAPGKWTIRQILAHLADAETVGAFRLRAVIAEDNPTLSAFDQDAWTAKLNYHRCEPVQSLDVFRCIRAGNYAVLKGVAESAYARMGNHGERSYDARTTPGRLHRARRAACGPDTGDPR